MHHRCESIGPVCKDERPLLPFKPFSPFPGRFEPGALKHLNKPQNWNPIFNWTFSFFLRAACHKESAKWAKVKSSTGRRVFNTNKGVPDDLFPEKLLDWTNDKSLERARTRLSLSVFYFRFYRFKDGSACCVVGADCESKHKPVCF